MSTTTTLPTPPPRKRRLSLPVLAILFPVVIRLLLLVANHYDFGGDAVFNLTLVFQMAIGVAFLLLAAWFFLLGGFSRRLRLGAILGLLALAGVSYAVVDRVEFDGQMNPRVYFTWEPKPEVVLEQHRANLPKADNAADLTVSPMDSPAYRGVQGDGATAEVRLADWTTQPPTIAWQQPCGGGHAGFAIAGNSAITIEQVGDQEAIVCYDRATGHERWSHTYPALFAQTAPMGGDGPRATPTIANGRVYALGATGELRCLEGVTGSLLWRKDILEENLAENIDWGMTGSPLVIGERVIVNPGAKRGEPGTMSVVAYHAGTGEKLWAKGTYRAAYASPMRATFEGNEQVLVFHSGGLEAFEPETGAILWFIPWKSPMDMNSAQPVIVGPNRVLISSEKDRGTAVYEITRQDGAWSPREVWKTRKVAARYACPVYFEGHVYGLSDGRLFCLEAETGTIRWQEGMFGNGQVIRTGDRLIVTSEKGAVHMVRATPEDYDELGSLKVFSDRTWNMPALAGHQLFVRNHREMACLSLTVLEGAK